MKKNKLFKTLALALAVSSLGAIAPNTLLTKANAASNWKSVNNVWYYMDSTGKTTIGWLKDGDDWYYLDSSGSMKIGWFQVDGNWYYCWSNGQLATNTTIDGYTADSNGVCILSNRGALTGRDIEGFHEIKIAAPGQVDYDACDLTLYKNIELSNKDTNLMEMFFYYLRSERLYLSEARSQCVGKIFSGKYLIRDVKFFQKDLKPGEFNCDRSNAQSIANFLKQSSLYDYKTTSPYVYDTSIVQLVGNGNTHWEIIRMVVEFEEI